MPKRSQTSTPSTPKRKQAKLADGQVRLDRFFSKSPDKRVLAEPSSSLLADSKTTWSDDEEYAAALAERDGLDLEATRRIEEQWKRTLRVPDAVADVDTSGCPQPSSIAEAEYRSSQTASSSSRTVGCTSDPLQLPEYPSFSFEPSTSILLEEPWPANTAAPYSFLAHILSAISETRSRIAILHTLTNALRTLIKCQPASLLPSLYLLSNTVSPPYAALELGLGPSIISKAIQHVSGLGPASIRRLYTLKGDPGDVAFEAKSNLRTLIPHPPLLITAVYDSLLKIATTRGQGATRRKQAIVEKLLVAAKGEETRFLTRTLAQNLRVGASRTSILTALARAMVLTPRPQGLMQGESLYHVSPQVVSQMHAAANTKTDLPDGVRDELKAKYLMAERLITKVYVQHPNYEDIVTALLASGLDGLAERVPLTVGIPLHPTLGSPIRSIDEIYERLGDLPFAAELKYDGQRAQIHALRKGPGQITVSLFSRHLEDMTSKYPDVSSLVEGIFERSPQTNSFIMDSEIVAIDPSDGSLKSFQELSNRARKDVLLQNVTIMVGVFAFDLMYLDGEILLEQPFRKRRSLLIERFSPFNLDGVSRFAHVESCDSEAGRDRIEEFWELALESKCEGLMIKLLDNGELSDDQTLTKDKPRRKQLPATYEPDKRTFAWLKLKRDYVNGLGDSLDLVPIGAWHGNGRKARWWSPILLAVWEPASARLIAVCKCMSGFTDEFYKALSLRYPENSDTCSQQPLWHCDTGGLKPKVYFKPLEIWEIRGADITLSPVSVAALGLVSESRGLSLRFPRFVRVRDDKTIEQASTSDFLAQMWRNQQGKGKGKSGVDDGELVDVDVEDKSEEEDILDLE